MTSTATSAPGQETDGAAAPRRRGRAVWGWIAIAILVVLIGGIGVALAGPGQQGGRPPLDPESAGPDGMQALARILAEHGVDVQIVRTRDDALGALERAESGATLVTPDAPYLSDEALESLLAAADDVVLIDARARALDLLVPGSSWSGFASGDAIAPGCDLPDAERAGGVTVSRTFEPGPGVDGCYPVDGAYGLLVAEHDGGRAAVLQASGVLTNDALDQEGNAALAAGLLGARDTLVWYMPSFEDTDITTPPRTLGELTPGWVTPAIVLLAIAAVAAGFWRGRRFGPLVVERLPVTVRAGETMEGRGRLYARSRDHVHAADALRIGATGRLAKALGLGAAASVHEVADAAADLIGAPRASVRGVLVDELPQSDAQLLSISDRLRDLERAVRLAVRDEGRNG